MGDRSQNLLREFLENAGHGVSPIMTASDCGEAFGALLSSSTNALGAILEPRCKHMLN
jgi:hypothetical protein